MPQAALVDVAAALQQSLSDVLTQARAKHAADLAAYREGVRGMADAGGSLPPEQAERLLAAARDLGIPPGRLADDATIMLRHARIEAAIEEVFQHYAEQQAPLPKLKEDLDAATQRWLEVKTRCEQEMRDAEAALNTKQRAWEEVASLRPARVDEQQTELLRLRNLSPYLFADCEPEMLRRMVQP